MKLLFKRYIFYLFFTVLVISGCGKKREKLPPGIWGKAQMIEFLTQAQLVEAKLAVRNTPQAERDSLIQVYYNELFLAYNTDKESWEQNMLYYKNNPDKLNEIYADVLSELSIMETELQAGAPKETKKEEEVSGEQKKTSNVVD